MASKIILRSYGSSIRTLINRHLRPTIAATTLQTQTPGSIHNCQYLLTNSSLPQTISFGRGFRNDAAGYSVLNEDRGRRKERYDEDSAGEDVDDGDIAMDDSEFDSDDSEFDSDEDNGESDIQDF